MSPDEQRIQQERFLPLIVTEVERSGYEFVYAPDGTDIAMLTEPEDRCCRRDIGKILDYTAGLLRERQAARDAAIDECANLCIPSMYSDSIHVEIVKDLAESIRKLKGTT